MRVYVVDANDAGDDFSCNQCSNEEFINEAERQEMIYSLEGFQKAFNLSEVNTEIHFIRFIEVEI
jgi:hypothetical protein